MRLSRQHLVVMAAILVVNANQASKWRESHLRKKQEGPIVG